MNQSSPSELPSELKREARIIKGIGCDIIEIERIHAVMRRHGKSFIERHFTAQERAYFTRYKDPTPQIAGRFAAKEAISKALGTGFGKELEWLDIEILNDAQGKPIATLSPFVLENFGDGYIEVSISHAKKSAVAFAIWLQ